MLFRSRKFQEERKRAEKQLQQRKQEEKRRFEEEQKKRKQDQEYHKAMEAINSIRAARAIEATIERMKEQT